MQEEAAVKYEISKSRFYAHLYRLDFADEYAEAYELHKKLYKKAAHHCSAFRFRMPDGRIVTDFKNDSEVGHPGKTLLNLLEVHNLESHALIVSRIFGGIKLGPSGVTRSFRDSGDAAIKSAHPDEK